MDLRRGFVFDKCFCCNKNFNVSQLIELNTNSIVIGETETLTLNELLLDVCFLSVTTSKKSFICEECKNQLVLFHMFKRDIKKYSSFAENIVSLEILSRVDEALKQIDNTADLQVFQFENMILVSTESDAARVEQSQKSLHTEPVFSIHHESLLEEVISNHATELRPANAEIEEEYIEEAIESETLHCEALPDEHSRKDVRAKNVEEPRRTKRQSTRKYKYPINTNEKLSEEEKDWINKQVVVCETTRNGQIAYKCPLCETHLQISGTFKKHLRDSHILKSEREQGAWNSQRAFKDEIKQSKLIVETSDGNSETVWKCHRCDNSRIFRSEAGLKVHIRFNHIRSQVIDAKFVAQCKITVDTENGLKDAWCCPECSKVLRSRDALRNHIKLEHPTALGGGEVQEKRKKNQPHDEHDVLRMLERKRRSLKTHAGPSSCEECGIQFINGTSKRDKSFRIHMTCHKILNVVSQYYQLPRCEASKTMFCNEEDLDTFLKSDQSFRASECEGMTAKVSRKFKNAVGTAIEGDLETWKCGHCRIKYQTEAECSTHVLILHSRKLVCPVDHLEFEGPRGVGHFNLHMHNKHPEMFPDQVISCTYCHHEFPTIFDRLRHMKSCSEKKFECDHCSRKFFAKTELIRHLKIVSGEISYTCDLCSKSCSSTMELKLHSTTHTNIKSYMCTYPACQKSFKTPAARSSHMETHGNVKFPCSSCSSSFRQRALLQRHLRKGFCKVRTTKDNSAHLVFEEVFDDSQIFEVTEMTN